MLKKLLPIAGAAAGYFLGGPAGSAALNAALGSGIGTLAAGGDPKDAVKNAILAGGAGAGLSSLGVQGAGAATAAGTEAAKQAAVQKAAETAATKKATEAAATEAAKQSGLFGTGITAADIGVGSSVLSALGVGDEEMEEEEFDPKRMEARPDYKGELIGGLFVDPVTGIAYDTVEDLEDAVSDRKNLAMGGIVALKDGGTATPGDAGYIEGPGTGTSDSVDAAIFQNGKRVSEAALSDGEFVFKEKSVVGAGNGDRELGAKRLYALMDKFERMA